MVQEVELTASEERGNFLSERGFRAEACGGLNLPFVWEMLSADLRAK